MKTKYKFIHFELVDEDPVEDTLLHWRCVNSKHKYVLGKVEWYRQWKLHCFFPNINIAFSEDCLGDIKHFISQLKA